MSKVKKILYVLCFVPYTAFIKSGNANYSWGVDALVTIYNFVVTMMPHVLYIYYIVASVFVVVVTLQTHIKMNTGEDGAVKFIVSFIGAHFSIIGASTIFPASLGYHI